MTALARCAWVALATVMVVLKAFALAVSAWRFERTVAWRDIACSFGGDALLALALLLPLLLLAEATRRGLPRGARRIAALVLSLLLVALIAAYLLSGYVFWEWGWWLEPPHVDAGRMAGVSADLAEFVLDRKMALVVVLFGATVAAAIRHARRLRRRGTQRRVVGLPAAACVALAMGAWAPIARPGAFDPAVPSPLLQFACELGAAARGLDRDRFPPSDAGLPATAERSAPAAEWAGLAGAARELDLVIVVLESTRRDRLQCYGAERATSPRLAALAANSLVLDEAWATQPRSCKTMEALVLGVDPAPCLESRTWDAMVPGGDSLLHRRAARGDRLYFGTSFAKETDGFDTFVAAAAGRRLERVVGTAELGAAARPTRQSYDDRVLVADFLRWRAAIAGAPDAGATALLWLAAAHHPYRATATPFREATLRDRYDNCVASADRAIGELVDGLAAQGRLASTLLVIVGDHGEALGERRDAFHGSTLRDYSLRVPCLLANARLFPSERRCDARFPLRDLPGTLLWLAGDPVPLAASRVLFANSREEPLLLSNVYQDWKLGLLIGDLKATWRPERDELWLHDRAADPAEQHDLAPALAPAERAAWRQRVIDAWWRSPGASP